ncbi:MAG: hypothetical protein B6A08_16740 [Sorangiineae bacterium NIC37A_2]|nr:MAG: hypothetical protein B6A08_16740 [Sorangiineae bacterium NIC37A_2]
MRSAAYVLVGFLLVLLQSILYRFWAPLVPLQPFGFPLSRLTLGITPNLVLPLVLFLAVQEPSLARGSLLSFCLGWGIDVIGGGPAYLYRFTMVAVWWFTRMVSARVSMQTLASRIPLAFVGSLLESFIVLTLLAIFGPDAQRPVELSVQVLPRAITTTLFAPLIFSLAARIQLESRPQASSQTS